VCSAPQGPFWEKATLIPVACNRFDAKLDADRQSRYRHDLAVLADYKIGLASLEELANTANVTPFTVSHLLGGQRRQMVKNTRDRMFVCHPTRFSLREL